MERQHWYKGHFICEQNARVNIQEDLQSTSTDQTVPLCPSYVPSRSPLSVYQTLITWSFEHVKSRSPSRLNLIWVSDRSCPVQDANKAPSVLAHIR